MGNELFAGRQEPGPLGEARAEQVGVKGVGAQEEKRRARVQVVDRAQTVLRLVDVEQLVGEEHAVRAIWELVGQLDLSEYYQEIKAVEGVAGREALDPRLLISLWLYAYSDGVSSAREVARLGAHDPAYQWLCGLQQINHHSLSDFRVGHGENLRRLFEEVLGVLSAEGLVSLARVTQDGTKVKANASADTYRREGRVRAHLELGREQVRQMEEAGEKQEVGKRRLAAQKRAAREKVERLEQALKELEKVRAGKKKQEKAEARVSLTDPEARIMKQADGGYGSNYNLQLTTDAAEKIIVGVGISQASGDQRELVGAVEQVEENSGQKLAQVIADAGYVTRENIIALAAKGIELIAPGLGGKSEAARRQMEEKLGIALQFRVAALGYDEVRDLYVCPAGKELVLEKRQKDSQRPGIVSHVYRAPAAACNSCEFKQQCCPGSEKGRRVTRLEEAQEVVEFNQKMEGEAAKNIYKERGETAEFPNAWLKDKINLRQFRVRGMVKVEMEAIWASLTYNVQQWIRLRWRPRLAEC
ncbi:MAG TPA: IS1182 family transposase [Pyrinomonadaceae bacterium]|nr:IS1182 family transposase [Pyrinomonadaceae bacterium]